MSQVLYELARAKQGPLITDGRNSSRWTVHYVGWSKTLQMVKISEQNF